MNSHHCLYPLQKEEDKEPPKEDKESTKEEKAEDSKTKEDTKPVPEVIVSEAAKSEDKVDAEKVVKKQEVDSLESAPNMDHASKVGQY